MSQSVVLQCSYANKVHGDRRRKQSEREMSSSVCCFSFTVQSRDGTGTGPVSVMQTCLVTVVWNMKA